MAHPEIIRRNSREARGTLGGFWEVPMCLGTQGHVAHSGSIRDSPGVSLGTRGLLGGLPEVVFGSGTRGQMVSSGVIRKGSPGLGYSGTHGTLRGKDRRVTRCGFRD